MKDWLNLIEEWRDVFAELSPSENGERESSHNTKDENIFVILVSNGMFGGEEWRKMVSKC